MEETPMNRNLAAALQVLTVLVGLAALAVLLWEPHVEGRNADATLFEIYFHDPFLAYAYTGSIAFFTALYQVFRLLGYVAARDVLSSRSVKALQSLKRCALTLIGFLVGAEVYFHFIQRAQGEDIAGGVMIGLVLMVACGGVAIAAAVLERSLRMAVRRRSA
jgi:predicted permease